MCLLAFQYVLPSSALTLRDESKQAQCSRRKSPTAALSVALDGDARAGTSMERSASISTRTISSTRSSTALAMAAASACRSMLRCSSVSAMSHSQSSTRRTGRSSGMFSNRQRYWNGSV